MIRLLITIMFANLGLGALTLAQAITKQENAPTRLNNPGALTWAPSNYCQVGKVGQLVQFCTPQDGADALDNQILAEVKKGWSLQQVFNSYAPASDPRNDPGLYASNVASWMGVDPTVNIASLDTTQLYGGVMDSSIPIAGDTVGNMGYDIAGTGIQLASFLPLPNGINQTDFLVMVVAIGIGVFLLRKVF